MDPKKHRSFSHDSGDPYSSHRNAQRSPTIPPRPGTSNEVTSAQADSEAAAPQSSVSALFKSTRRPKASSSASLECEPQVELSSLAVSRANAPLTARGSVPQRHSRMGTLATVRSGEELASSPRSSDDLEDVRIPVANAFAIDHDVDDAADASFPEVMKPSGDSWPSTLVADGTACVEETAREKARVEQCIRTLRRASLLLDSLLEQRGCLAPSVCDSTSISAGIREQVDAGRMAAAQTKSSLDAMKRTVESLCTQLAAPPRDGPTRAAWGGERTRLQQRLVVQRAAYEGLCRAFLDAAREHQRVKEALREAEIETLVRLTRRAGGGAQAAGGRPSLQLHAAGGVAAPPVADSEQEERLRQCIRRDPAAYVQLLIQQQQQQQQQRQGLSGTRLSADVDAEATHFISAARARDTLVLTRSLAEVSDLCRDVSLLLDHQTAQLDTVLGNVDESVEHVRMGTGQLREALKKQRRKRKCVCCSVCTSIILLAVLAVLVSAAATGALKAL